ncbi:MAG: hypothetical protein VW867_07140 [Gammaproteobacteria bacterium]
MSLQSTQYSFLAEMLQKKYPPPQKNWRVIWRNKEYLSYAVNFENGTYFANEEGLLVSFDGWQVVGLNLPGLGVNKVADIDHHKQLDGYRLLTYKDGLGRSVSIDRCEPWEKIINNAPANEGTQVWWLQRCRSGDHNYRNQIKLNDRGQLVGLVFTVMKKMDPVVIESIQ